MLTNFLNKQRPLQCSEDDEAIRALLHVAAACRTVAPAPCPCRRAPGCPHPRAVPVLAVARGHLGLAVPGGCGVRGERRERCFVRHRRNHDTTDVIRRK